MHLEVPHKFQQLVSDRQLVDLRLLNRPIPILQLPKPPKKTMMPLTRPCLSSLAEVCELVLLYTSFKWVVA